MHPTRVLAALAGLLFLTGPTFAQNDVTLENLSWRDPDGKSAINLARVDVVNTNLTRDEVSKLLSDQTSAVDRAALAGRMTAGKLAITGATLDTPDSKLALGPIEVAGVDQGRFATATFDGFSGTYTGGTLTGRALRLEGGDLGPLLGAIQTHNPGASAFQVGRVTWDGFDGEFKDPQATSKDPAANKVKIHLGSLTAATDFKSGLPVNSTFDASGFVLEPALESEFGKSLRAFGYERIELGLTGAGQYDPDAQKLVVQDYSIAGSKAGRLSLSGGMTGVDGKALASSDPGERGLALLGASVDSLKIDFVNQGLVEKSFAFAAAKQGKTPAALRSDVAAMAVQLLPLLLGGDPQSLALAQSVQAFLSAPKNFSLSLKARGAPVPLAQLGSIGDPKAFLALVNVTLTANQ